MTQMAMYQETVYGMLGGVFLPFRSVHCKLCVTVNTKTGGS